MNFSEKDLYLMSVIQQALRQVMISLAGASKANFVDLSSLLAESAQNAALEPMTRKMMEDLALGAAQMAKATQADQTDH